MVPNMVQSDQISGGRMDRTLWRIWEVGLAAQGRGH